MWLIPPVGRCQTAHGLHDQAGPPAMLDSQPAGYGIGLRGLICHADGNSAKIKGDIQCSAAHFLGAG